MLAVASSANRFAAGFVLLALPSGAIVGAIAGLIRPGRLRTALLALVAGPLILAWAYLVTFGFVLDEH